MFIKKIVLYSYLLHSVYWAFFNFFFIVFKIRWLFESWEWM